MLDFGGNVLRHGPVDEIKVREPNATGNGQAPAKECPGCQALIAAGYATCPVCGYVFPSPERQKHDAKASEAGILSGQVTTTVYQVQDTFYGIHTKRGADDSAPKTLRVDYKVGWQQFKSEWVCFEHDGYAQQKAVAWWKRRSPDPVPDTVERAVDIINGGGLATTRAITVRTVAGEQFERIVDYDIGPMPEAIPAGEVRSDDSDEIPF